VASLVARQWPGQDSDAAENVMLIRPGRGFERVLRAQESAIQAALFAERAVENVGDRLPTPTALADFSVHALRLVHSMHLEAGQTIG